jgi:leader peptidase (prepilin peptidase)/N-methyltransferase
MLPEAIVWVFVFLFAASVGSFLNVCIHRLPAGESIVFPPSACPACKSKLKSYDNIPIISYLALGAKCRSCGVKISAIYPLVEFLTGAFGIALYYTHGLTIDALIYFCFVAALIAITFIDLKHQIIPDKISLPAIPLGFAASFLLQGLGWLDSLVGIALGGGVLLAVAVGFALATGKEGMGGGDIKLLAMIGAFLGWKSIIFVLVASSLAGALIGSAYLLAKSRDRGEPIPFGPFLALGAIGYLFFGEAAISFYIDTIWAH